MIRKIFGFLLSVIILVMTLGVLYFTSIIKDSAEQIQIQPFFFQGNDLYSMRVGVPAGIDDLGEKKVVEKLIKKFVTEYFYVTPDAENIARRMRAGSSLYQITSASVFNDWKTGEAVHIQELSSDGVFRTVDIDNEIQKPVGSDYWVVNYKLTTWTTPNNFDIAPEVSRGTMFITLIYEEGIRESIIEMGIHKYLDEGGNIADVFKFMVTDVILR